jgi:signal transduction histidine kinase
VSADSPADRTPNIDQLIRADDLERSLRPFLDWGLAGIALFARDCSPFLRLGTEGSPILRWDVLPPEAEAASRSSEERTFGLERHRFEVRPAFAGADRVGVMVFAVEIDGDGDGDGDDQRLGELADALSGVIASLLQSGFATWVTSELHLAASESSYRALEGQNEELQRAVEHLRELDVLKSNFLATVSHELRTPLTSVIGFSEMLLKGIAGDLNEEQDEYVTTILERGEELLRLITQILEMSRMEMGTLHLSVRTVPLVEIAERALSSVRITAEQAGVRVYHELAEDLPPVVVDADKVQQVLVNLVSNATKFNRPDGEVVIGAKLAPIRRPFEEETFFGDEDDDALLVSVRDSGVGIPAEQLARIFDAFYQVDASSTRAHGGAGLGLSIVRRLIEAHGGEVWAESTVEVGTTFFFTLPLSIPEGVDVVEGDNSSGYEVHSAETLADVQASTMPSTIEDGDHLPEDSETEKSRETD